MWQSYTCQDSSRGTVVAGPAMMGLRVGVTPPDPFTLAVARWFLSAVAFAACDVPARRTVRRDPTIVRDCHAQADYNLGSCSNPF
jgi:hypothetical protein